jgi:hypothetical protein
MIAFSYQKGVVTLPTGTPSGFLPLVKDTVAMQFFIMEHSLSLCLTGYTWLGQVTSRSFLK